jgi:hypothetical protein
MSDKASSSGKSEAGPTGLPGEVVVKLGEIADELEQVPVVTRAWRKQTAYELRVIAEGLGGGAKS